MFPFRLQPFLCRVCVEQTIPLTGRFSMLSAEMLSASLKLQASLPSTQDPARPPARFPMWGQIVSLPCRPSDDFNVGLLEKAFQEHRSSGVSVKDDSWLQQLRTFVQAGIPMVHTFPSKHILFIILCILSPPV